MAKRASLSFEAMKAPKPLGPSTTPEAPKVETPEAKATQDGKRGRGRPVKRDPGAKVYGMTLRIPGHVRVALRRLAESETDKRGRIVSVHDVIVQAVESHLARKGFKAEADE